MQQTHYFNHDTSQCRDKCSYFVSDSSCLVFCIIASTKMFIKVLCYLLVILAVVVVLCDARGKGKTGRRNRQHLVKYKNCTDVCMLKACNSMHACRHNVVNYTHQIWHCCIHACRTLHELSHTLV